ncbi:MAG: hypothetical protein O2779_00550 [Nanoarchaeota archaeon]|nr:hypothetical protein [Nanoarchaeota archaeon]
MKRVLGVFMAILAVVAIILVFGATYLLVIEPNSINKPDIEKPPLAEKAAELADQGQAVITTNHLDYLINEMGGYKLKPSPVSKDPAVMEFYLTDTKTHFTTVITDNVPKTIAGKAIDPDVRLSGTQRTIITVLSSDNMIEAIQKELDIGTIQAEILKDAKVLGFKGYLSIYELFK